MTTDTATTARSCLAQPRIIRVFTRKTNCTPDDDLARVGFPGIWDTAADEIHISVTFDADIPLVEQLEKQWKPYGPVKIGGRAYGDPGGEFVPGMYLKEGYTITSRGCPNRCWFCDVWRREGPIREIGINPGWNVLDSNLLACSESHIRAVFSMLKEQKQKTEFTGGLEAKRLQAWHVEELQRIKPKQMFFAYDEPADLEPLQVAGKMLTSAGFTKNHCLRCYVLVGFTGDTKPAAWTRMKAASDAGFFPMGMVWLNAAGKNPLGWVGREFANPSIVAETLKGMGK